MQDDPPAVPAQDPHPSAELASEILLVLGSFANLLNSSQGGMEGYDKVFYGCIDVLAARADTEGIKRMFEPLKGDHGISAARAAFMMRVGEQLVQRLDGETVKGLLELCQR